ncbi:MAG: host-nuclease inhibitor Gam family protein, partial [Pseudomonadota bacterium]
VGRVTRRHLIMDLPGIERFIKTYADAAGALGDAIGELEADLESRKRARMKEIKSLVARTAEAKAKLHAAIEAAPQCFEKPKTITVSGVRVGLQKGKGQMDWEDDDALVAKIEKHFGKDAEHYLIIKKKPSATALNELETAELRRLGVTVEETGEQIVIRHVDGAVEKLVRALLKAKLNEAMEAA